MEAQTLFDAPLADFDVQAMNAPGQRNLTVQQAEELMNSSQWVCDDWVYDDLLGFGAWFGSEGRAAESGLLSPAAGGVDTAGPMQQPAAIGAACGAGPCQEYGALLEDLCIGPKLRDSRLILALKGKTAVAQDSVCPHSLELHCTFHAAEDARFTCARVVVILESPAGSKFIDYFPKEVKDPNAVNVTVSHTGTFNSKLTVTAGPLSGELGGELKNSSTYQYVQYKSLVTGSGSDTNTVQWIFVENPVKEVAEGVACGEPHKLWFTLKPGTYTATVLLTAVVRRRVFQFCNKCYRVKSAVHDVKLVVP